MSTIVQLSTTLISVLQCSLPYLVIPCILISFGLSCQSPNASCSITTTIALRAQSKYQRLVSASAFHSSSMLGSPFNCYDSLPGQCSFSYFFFSCHISFSRVPFLCSSSLSSYPGTPYFHHMHPLIPTLFLVLLLDRGYSLLIFSQSWTLTPSANSLILAAYSSYSSSFP